MFEQAFELSPVLQAVIDGNGRILNANARFRAAFGQNVLGQSITDLLGRSSQGLGRILASFVETRKPFVITDVLMRLGGSGDVRMEARGILLDDGSGLVTLVDFTERVTEATARAQRDRFETISRFAGGLAHDLNNLLAAIMATAEAGSADASAGEGDACADFAAIIDEAERGASLARSLRAIAFDETGSWRPVDLRAEIKTAAAVLRRGPRAVPITVELDESVPEIVGDRARLHQLVLNLLINARDATFAHGGDIIVRLRNAEDGGCEFVVADGGPGVPPELRERIFQPYFSTKRRSGEGEGAAWGTGLGLAIVDAVVRSTGAAVTVGDRPGGGAVFTVHWPASSVSRDSIDVTRHAPADVSPALVLLADNEAALVGAVARQLRRLGHSVYAAMSAAECRRLFNQYRDSIDVAVIDVRLGDGDGRELAQQFRVERPDLAIVLISASASALGDAPPSARALAKPFDVEDLTNAIEQARCEAREVRP